MDKIYSRKVLLVKNGKVNITTEFCISELVQLPKLTLNWQFWFFEPNLPKKKVVSQQKQKKVNITIEFCIFELVSLPNSSLNWKFWFFPTKLAQIGYFQSWTEKSHFCLSPRSLLTILYFTARGPTDTEAFLNFCPPSSRRNKNLNHNWNHN